MLNKEEKVAHATYMQKNVQKRLYEIELEKRLLERKKTTVAVGQLATVENVITALRAEEKSYNDKNELLTEELEKLKKQK